MNANIISLLQMINSLLWVYDIDKSKELIDKAKIILAEINDPSLMKILNKYIEVVKELEDNGMQIQLEDLSDIGSRNIFHSNKKISSLLIIQNKYEADIRGVITDGFLWDSDRCQPKVTMESKMNPEIVTVAEKMEKSDTGVVYEFLSTTSFPRFGAITFTSRGIVEGKIYAKNLFEIKPENLNEYFEIREFFFYLADNVYGITKERPSDWKED